MLRLALVVAVLAALHVGPTAAQGQQVQWYCPTWNAYYPGVVNCPVPWRAISLAPSGAYSAEAPSAGQGPIPLSPPPARPIFRALGDSLDDWCAKVTQPRSIAVCSDAELRALQIEWQHAFDQAKSRLDPEQQQALVVDQNGWVRTYAANCGLPQDTPPSLPLAPAVKDCMAAVGRERIAYLRSYDVADTGPEAGPPTVSETARPAQIGPGFDCSKATATLAHLICTNGELSEEDLRFNQAYYALYYQLNSEGRRQLHQEDLDFLGSVQKLCGVPEIGPIAGSAECVGARYEQQRSRWLVRLTGPALEEANRPPEQSVALQSQLQALGFLPDSTQINGVYGAATRSAIIAWQRKNGRSETGFLGNADATALDGADTPLLSQLSQRQLGTSTVLPNEPPPANGTSAPATAQPPAASETSSSAGQSETSPERGEGWGFATTFWIICGVIIVGGVIKERIKAVDRRRRIKEACAYINAVNERRYFPMMPVNINLQPGEFGLLQSPAALSEMRSHGYSTGSSIRIAKGVWVSGRQYHSHRTRDIVDRGVVVITTRRIAFTGGSKTAQVRFRELVAIEGDIDCNILHTSSRRNAIFIHYREALLGLILVRFLASMVLADNRLPTGVHLEAHASGDSIAIDVTDATSPAAT